MHISGSIIFCPDKMCLLATKIGLIVTLKFPLSINTMNTKDINSFSHYLAELLEGQTSYSENWSHLFGSLERAAIGNKPTIDEGTGDEDKDVTDGVDDLDGIGGLDN